MLVLTEITDKIQVVLGGSVTTNQLRCMSCWRDITTTIYTPGRTLINTNNTTDVDLVGSPGASTQRVVDFLNVYNYDTVSQTVTVKFDANGTEYILWTGILSKGERLEYTNEHGFVTFSINGLIKQLGQSAPYVINSLNVVILASDVINNNAVANTIQDVTGLSFSAVAGEMYYFEFTIFYTAAATTTGSRWSLNGPASPTKLIYATEYSLAATTTTINANSISYDLPAASNPTSGSTGHNKAEIRGMIQPSSNGTVIARFASEVANSAITAKAGSILQYMRVL